MAQQGQDNQGFPSLDIRAARALNPHTRTIQIQSILGGHSLMSNFGAKGQFQTSLALDPSLPIDFQAVSGIQIAPSGLLRQTSSRSDLLASVVNDTPLWIKTNPKDNNFYMYDFSGSVYAAGPLTLSGTALSDAGNMSSASGNGAEYYDNYMYFAKNTDIARYGPLNGSPSFNPSYWQTTLSKAALTNTTYPKNIWIGLFHGTRTVNYPNHVMHRHSDGKLYIADVQGNQGTLHVISTTKTTVEGDTDNGSTAQKLLFGYGLWPTVIESYGSQLVIALYEGQATTSTNKFGNAKIAFWDTTSQSFNSITWVEFPDALVTGIKNVDGVLYFVSGNPDTLGFRVSQYVGGTTFKDVINFNDSAPPFAGAIDGASGQLIFGGATVRPETAGVVYSSGLAQNVSKGIFSVLRVPTSYGSSPIVTAVSLDQTDNLTQNRPILAAFTQGSGTTNNSVASQYFDNDSSFYDAAPSMFWSEKFVIGAPFKITKIRFPLAHKMSVGMIVTPKIYTDDGYGPTYTGGTSNGLAVMNNTNYPTKRKVVMRPENVTGEHNFWLELRWTGAAAATVSLPITIEYELIPD